MASALFAVAAFICLSLLPENIVVGKDAPANSSLVRETKDLSPPHENDVMSLLPQVTQFQRNYTYKKSTGYNRKYNDSKINMDGRCYGDHGSVYINKPIVYSAKIEVIGPTYTKIWVTMSLNSVPIIFPTQRSSAFIFLEIGYNGNLQWLDVGWEVDPGLYGDSQTRLFTDMWEHKGRQCYNLCNGDCFTLDDTSDLKPGGMLMPLSVPDGAQYVFNFVIERDARTGHWWLYHRHSGSKPIGYWPSSVIRAPSISSVELGGSVSFTEGALCPPMGSGRFASEGKGKAAFIRAKGLTKRGKVEQLRGKAIMTKPSHYTITGDGTYYFGGPGGCMD